MPTARLFEHVLSAFEGIGDLLPTVVVIEDLHWAERSTRDLLVFLARNLRAGRVLVVGTYRTDDLHRRHPLRPVLAELERSGVERIDVERFTRAEVRELLAGILDQEPSADLVGRIHDRSDGNAFFAEELLAAADDCGVAVSPSLRDVVLARLDTLPPSAQEVLRLVAVIGRRAEHRLLVALADQPEVELNEGAARGPGATRCCSPTPTATWTCTSSGTRRRRRSCTTTCCRGSGCGCTPAWRSCSPTTRRCSTARRRRWPTSSHVIGTRRVTNGGRWSRRTAPRSSPRRCTRTPRRSSTRNARSSSGRWSKEPRGSSASTRSGCSGYAAEQADLAGEIDRAAALVREASARVDPATDPVTVGVLLERQARVAWIRGELASTLLPLNHQAVELVPATPPSTERAHVLAALGQQLMLAGRNEDAIEWCEQAIAVAQEAGNPVVEGHARNTLGTVLAHLGDIDDGLVQLHCAHDLAQEQRAWGDLARAAINESGVLQADGRHTDAIEISLRGADEARGHGLDRSYGSFLRLNAAGSLWLLGRWAECEEQLREIDAVDPVGIDAKRVCEEWAMLHIARGEFDLAAQAIERDRTLATDRPWPELDLAGRANEVRLLRWRGEPEPAYDVVVGSWPFKSDPTVGRFDCPDSCDELLVEGIGAAADAAERARGRRDTEAEATAVEQARSLRQQLVLAHDRFASRARLPFDVPMRDALTDAEVQRAARPVVSGAVAGAGRVVAEGGPAPARGVRALAGGAGPLAARRGRGRGRRPAARGAHDRAPARVRAVARGGRRPRPPRSRVDVAATATARSAAVAVRTGGVDGRASRRSSTC